MCRHLTIYLECTMWEQERYIIYCIIKSCWRKKYQREKIAHVSVNVPHLRRITWNEIFYCDLNISANYQPARSFYAMIRLFFSLTRQVVESLRRGSFLRGSPEDFVASGEERVRWGRRGLGRGLARYKSRVEGRRFISYSGCACASCHRWHIVRQSVSAHKAAKE